MRSDDPPYHLTSVVKRFGGPDAAPAQFGKDGAFQRASTGFMGKQWDGGDIAFRPETWAAVMRVLKPGGHLVAFSGTRTYHRMACAIEDAGFEIRDQLAWTYGQGFPKVARRKQGNRQGGGRRSGRTRDRPPPSSEHHSAPAQNAGVGKERARIPAWGRVPARSRPPMGRLGDGAETIVGADCVLRANPLQFRDRHRYNRLMN